MSNAIVFEQCYYLSHTIWTIILSIYLLFISQCLVLELQEHMK